MDKPTFSLYKVRCKKCNDIIWSRFPGEYVSCSCKAVGIDTTEYYTRLIGNPKEYEKVEDDK